MFRRFDVVDIKLVSLIPVLNGLNEFAPSKTFVLRLIRALAWSEKRDKNFKIPFLDAQIRSGLQ